MKQLFYAIGLSFISALTYAQNCNMFFPLEEGASWEVTFYNAKGKEQDTQINTITSKKTVKEGEEAVVSIEIKDTKEKDQIKLDYKVLCAENYLMIGITMFTPDTQTEDVEIEMTTENLEFPKNLNEGLELKPGSMNVTTKRNGIKLMSMEFNIVDRKVEGKEFITTSVGTFECFKINQTINVKIGFVKTSTTSTVYFAKNVGIVKTAHYNKKGKLTSYQELTKIN
ncbi:MAG: hypothetical protein ACI8Q1_001558 [Parvicella sp.]|jgi:hypothetical protein